MCVFELTVTAKVCADLLNFGCDCLLNKCQGWSGPLGHLRTGHINSSVQEWNYVLIRRQDPLENNSPVRKELSWTGELLLDTEDSLDSHTDSAEDSVVIEDFAFSDQRNFFRIPPYCKLSLSGETVYATDRDFRIKNGNLSNSAKYYHFMVM